MIIARNLREQFGIECPVRIAAAEVPGPDFPDQIAPVLAVVLADAAFAGIVRKVAELGALVEGADGVGAERAEAHGRDVEHRQRVGLAAFAVADFHAEVVAGGRDRRDRMIDPFERVTVDVLLGTERTLVERALRTLVGNRALRAVVGRAVGVAFEKVLADLGPDPFQTEADVGHDRIVATQAVLGLDEVPDADRAGERAQSKQDKEHEPERSEQSEDQRPRKAGYDRDVPHCPSPFLLEDHLFLKSTSSPRSLES